SEVLCHESFPPQSCPGIRGRHGHCFQWQVAQAQRNNYQAEKILPRRNPMSPRQANLIWLKDMLEHLDSCRKQLEWAQDHLSQQIITDTLFRDLDCCKRLCETLRRRGTPAVMAN